MTGAPSIDLMALLWSVVNTVLTFGGGTLAVAVAGWLVDTLAKRIPFLAPYRDLIVQWIAAQVEAIRRQRAMSVVKEAGQAAKAGLLTSTERAKYATQALVDRGVTSNPNHAAALVEQAVGALKSQGVNP